MTTVDPSPAGQAPPVPLPIDVTTVAHLQGPFAPVIEETDATNLPVEGQLPRELDGVYLVGGGTHPGSGLPVIFESARITARLMAEDLNLTPEWDAPSAMARDHYEPVIAEAL